MPDDIDTPQAHTGGHPLIHCKSVGDGGVASQSKTIALARDAAAEYEEKNGWQRIHYGLMLPGVLAIAIPSCILLDLHQLARGGQP